MNAGQLLNLRHQIDVALDGMKKELEAQLVQNQLTLWPSHQHCTSTVRKKGPLAGRKVAPKYRNPTNTEETWAGRGMNETGELSMIDGISAVTLGTHEMPRAVRFYRALGFEILHGGEESPLTSFRAGASYLNLIAQPAERRWSWWGRVIFYVADVDELYDRALAAGCQPTAAPRDAEWGERFFHLVDPDGHELSFARLLRSSV